MDAGLRITRSSSPKRASTNRASFLYWQVPELTARRKRKSTLTQEPPPPPTPKVEMEMEMEIFGARKRCVESKTSLRCTDSGEGM